MILESRLRMPIPVPWRGTGVALQCTTMAGAGNFSWGCCWGILLGHSAGDGARAGAGAFFLGRCFFSLGLVLGLLQSSFSTSEPFGATIIFRTLLIINDSIPITSLD
jgi:hypothetical protein